MKVYLDDIRSPLPGYSDWDIIVRNYESCIELLATNKVTEISLDHDLGTEKTGYDVLLWIEHATVFSNFNVPIIWIHTSNLSAKEKMMLAVEKTYLLSGRKQTGL